MTFPRSCIRFFHDCREATLLSLWGNKLVLWSRSERDEQRRRGQQIGTNKALASLSRSCSETCFGWRSMLFWFRGSCHDNSIHRLFLKTYSVFGDQVFTYSGQAGAALSTLPFTEQPAIIYWKWDSSSDTEPRMTTHSFHLGLAFIKRETGTK